MSSSQPRPDAARSVLKRSFDVLASAFGLLVLAPILIALAVLVRSRFGSPVLFRQTRAGLDGKPFEILKFRTMTMETDAEGRLLPDDRRLTSFGKFLRGSSLDELPELINVVRGEMSLVGPRPLVMRYLARYSPEQARRNLVRPGITGLAQVRGRNELSWEERFALDVEYVDNWSFLLDLKILAWTVGSVLRREGISTEGHATAPEFLGSEDAPPEQRSVNR